MNEKRQHCEAPQRAGQSSHWASGAAPSLRRGLAALAVGLLLAAASHGARESETADGATSQEQEQPETAEAASDGSAPSTEVFLPTEEISEDYAAPFPVDI